MFKVYQSIEEYLETTLTLYSDIALNGLTSNSESITIKEMPSGASLMDFDTDRVRNLQFQVMTKSLNQELAMQTIEQIAESLQNVDIVVVGYRSIYCLINSEPRYLERTNKQEYIFTASFKVEVEKER